MEYSVAHDIKTKFNSIYNNREMYCYIMPDIELNHAAFIARYASDMNFLRTDLVNDKLISSVIKDNPQISSFTLYCFKWNEFDINQRMLWYYPLDKFIEINELTDFHQ